MLSCARFLRGNFVLKHSTMKTVIVFNHPYEGSYCKAILDAVSRGLNNAGHQIDLIHLDNDNFNPVMTAKDLKGFVDGQPQDAQVINYRDRINSADRLVIIFPIWWELMPAMTKGFIDKVIFPGVAYDYDHSGRFPRMIKRWNKLNSVTVITTMNTPSIAYRLLFGNAIKKAIFNGTFRKLGFKNRRWISFNMVKFVSPAKRVKWLKNIEKQFESVRV
jgi:NAD(P)H dehydrogenase (quinone)